MAHWLRAGGLAAACTFAAPCIFTGLPAAAQNAYSFLDADKSVVDYRRAPVAAQMACHDLRKLSGGQITIIRADAVAAFARVPAFCRVTGVIAPEIQFEVALPLNWNRRIYMRGNGGYAGEALDAPPRVAQRNAALMNGFVAVQTNTGHDAGTEPLATFAQNLQKTIDYSFRAVHTTIDTAKRLARAFYDRPASYSYWDGCSTGGRQGLMSAQRFPGDFDGIIAGAPVLNFTGTMMQFAWNTRALAKAPISFEKIAKVADAVYKKCDAADGAADGLIENPKTCNFDPAADLPKCSGAETPDCFTAGQIETLKAIYAGVTSNGMHVFPGVPLSAEKSGTPFLNPAAPSESGWGFWLLSKEGPARQFQYGETFFRYMAFGKADPGYDLGRFDFDKDPARMGAIHAMLDATDPDLSAFRSRGGKIVMYHGWSDTALSPYMSIGYYEQVTEKLGPATKDFMRLFMVPGMFHCRGGIGVDRIDALTPLINWVENGTAPARLVGARMEGEKIVRARPLCPYPQTAHYTGSGSLDDAANFACRD
jgi:feruloyl esterase